MTNAEMAQFIGSQNFVEDIIPIYDDIYNINIDCVGAKSAGPLALKNISRIEDSSILYDSLKETLKENNIEYSDTFSTDKVEYFYNNNSGVSDYFSFEKNGIPNIHIAQQGISDLILNDNDNPENLDFNKIDILGDTLAKFIQQINLDSQKKSSFIGAFNIYILDYFTSSIIAIGAASPRRTRVLITRVYPPLRSLYAGAISSNNFCKAVCPVSSLTTTSRMKLAA